MFQAPGAWNIKIIFWGFRFFFIFFGWLKFYKIFVWRPRFSLDSFWTKPPLKIMGRVPPPFILSSYHTSMPLLVCENLFVVISMFFDPDNFSCYGKIIKISLLTRFYRIKIPSFIYVFLFLFVCLRLLKLSFILLDYKFFFAHFQGFSRHSGYYYFVLLKVIKFIQFLLLFFHAQYRCFSIDIIFLFNLLEIIKPQIQQQSY